jgi:tetratricopeptide (TPR) repeat protein
VAVGARRARANVLLEQRRYDLAERELREALAADPDDAELHALLAVCLLERGDTRAATDEAQRAIGLGPDLSVGHYALARALIERNRFDEARTSIQEAIRLEPRNSGYFSTLGATYLGQSRWQEALRASEEGLAIDPQDDGCLNVRAMALTKLGRGSEAAQAVESALALDPESALSHANHGWTALHRSQHQEALEAFREALRLDPNLDWAREGIVEALKARNPIYRLILRYFLLMSRLTGGRQLLVVIALFFGVRAVAGALGAAGGMLDVAAGLLVVIYLLFVLLSWLAVPIFNLLLRLDRFGRLTLSRDELLETNLFLGLLAAGVVLLLLGMLTHGTVALFGLLGVFLLLIPLSATFRSDPGWPRTAMAVYTALLAALVGGAVFFALLSPERPPSNSPAWALFGLALVGGFLSSFVGAFLSSRTPKG